MNHKKKKNPTAENTIKIFIFNKETSRKEFTNDSLRPTFFLRPKIRMTFLIQRRFHLVQSESVGPGAKDRLEHKQQLPVFPGSSAAAEKSV